MSKVQAQNVILCEDRQHSDFLRHDLTEIGYNFRQIYIVPVPPGSAEQFVRENYSMELRAHRSRAAYQSRNLLVMIDADVNSAGMRLGQLTAKLEACDIPPRGEEEHVAIFVPRRIIETWIKFLTGEFVDEVTNYKPHSRSRLPTKPAARRLLEIRATGWHEPPGCPESLSLAFKEFQRLR